MKHIWLLILTTQVLFLNAQNIEVSKYRQTFDTLKIQLESGNVDFKKAVFMTENSFLDGRLDQGYFYQTIDDFSKMAIHLSSSDALEYEEEDRKQVELSAAIFKIITDTTYWDIGDSLAFVHLPFRYDFEDIFGDGNWNKMFVSKLLQSERGNCHSLPYLYKIIADELEVEAHLALAPNHIYIKQRSEKTGWYNTELTSASFPIDAWLMASGYIYIEAIQNGIYMRALSDKESITLCVIDLAMGYDRKFPFNDGIFTLECCDLALEHSPNNINALLLKAETQKRQFQQKMVSLGVEYPSQAFHNREAKALFEEMQSIYFKIHKLGYRQMPKEMYLDWLTSLNEEREKYGNKKLEKINGNN